MRRKSHFYLLAPLAFALASCQAEKPTLSLEKAKQVTAKFESTSFTPPPRTIDDITAILDAQKPDPEKITALKVKASADPPRGASAAELIEFHYHRAHARMSIGRSVDALADGRAAYRYYSRTGASNIRRGVVSTLGLLERQFGNHRTAVEFNQRLVRLHPSIFSERGLFWAYLDGGNIRRAKETKARIVDIASDMALRQNDKPRAIAAVIRAQVEAEFFEAEGRWREAEPWRRKQIVAAVRFHSVEPNFPRRVEFYVRGLTAINLMRQGRLLEAESMAREALLGSLKHLGVTGLISSQLVGMLSSIVRAQGRAPDAVALAKYAVQASEKAGTPRGSLSRARLRFLLIEALASNGNWAEVVREFESLRADMKMNSALFKKLLDDQVYIPIALVRVGRPSEAMQLLESTLAAKVKRLRSGHFQTAESIAALGMAQAASGKKRKALTAFRNSIPVLLDTSRQIDREQSTKTDSARRLAYFLESYIGVLASSWEAATSQSEKLELAAEAFQMADIARSRSVRRALDQSGARAAAGDPELIDLVRREQDARKQISAFYGRLTNVLSSPTDQQDKATLRGLRGRIEELALAQSALAEEIEVRFPEYANLVNPKPLGLDDIRRSLGSDEAIIATYVGADRSFVWALPKQGPLAFAAVKLGRAELRGMVDRLRAALVPNAVTLGDIPAFDIALAHDLYRRLLQPIEPGWRQSKSILMVADGPLSYLPFSLLPTKAVSLPAEGGALFQNYREVPWLVRRHAVTVLPSIASLSALRALPPPTSNRRAFVGFGDPYFNVEQMASAAATSAPTTLLASRGGKIKIRGIRTSLKGDLDDKRVASSELAQLQRLPDTATEVRSIARVLGVDAGTSVFVGRRASEGRVKSMDLSKTKVLAFATHGLIPGDLNGLAQPALALSAPAVTGEAGEDGLLTMGEVLGLRLDADWVVLSACNTAAAEAPVQRRSPGWVVPSSTPGRGQSW